MPLWGGVFLGVLYNACLATCPKSKSIMLFLCILCTARLYLCQALPTSFTFANFCPQLTGLFAPTYQTCTEMATQSLCFRDAANAKRDGRISLENYLQHILSHYNGVRHESDVPGQDVWLGSDHFAISVRNSVIRDGFVPLEGMRAQL